MTLTAEPSWSQLVSLVGRLVRVTPCASDGLDAVPLTVADVSEAVTSDAWSAFTVSLVGTAQTRLITPGRYHVDVDHHRFDMILTWANPQRPHQHYRATLVQPV
jgi:hypothetical protein